MKRFILAITATVLMSGPAAAQTVIIVRHAEKADQSADPLLSEAGQLRALALSQVLADANVTQVLSTPLNRTRDTARLTAEAAHVPVTEISLDGGGAAHIARVAAAVRAFSPADVVLVVGHSNTVDQIAKALGDPEPETLTDCDYDRLVVLTLDGEGANVVRGRYGAPSPC